jgi:hypothetical protein
MINVGSPLVDVAIGLAFVFFLVSLICAGINEVIAAIFRLRARFLEKSLRQLLAYGGNGSPTQELLNHPLITVSAAGSKTMPSYISARTFSLALLDTLAPAEAANAGDRNLLESLRASLQTLPEDLKRQLLPILDETEADLEKLRTGIEKWFDDTMDRVSGWYKRRSQWFLFGIAIAVTIGLNISAVRIADRLWNDESVRSSVANAASQAAQAGNSTGGTTSSSSTGGPTSSNSAGGASSTGTTTTTGTAGAQTTTEDPAKDAQDAGTGVVQTTHTLAALKLPIGWDAANDRPNLAMIGGWLLTILAATLGAPFWFDALSRLAPLRSSGKKPEKSSGSQAEDS